MTEWKGKTRGGTFGYLFFIFLIKKCGISIAYTFLSMVVLYFIPFAPKATKNIWHFARKRLKLPIVDALKLIVRNYYTLGQTLIDKIAIGSGLKHKYKFEFDNYAKFLEILNAETGSIIIGAHIGCWEIGAPFFNEYGKKINIVLFDAEYEKIKEILNKNTSATPHKVIPVNKNSLSHVLAIKEALDNNEYVCFQGDRYVNEERCTEHAFMGKNAIFPQGPFLLAVKMKVPVVFYFAMREKNKTYRFHFTIATPPDTKNNTDAISDLLNQYTCCLENIVKKYPEQWFNYYDFWNENKNEKA